jgi:hypothetical protein
MVFACAVSVVRAGLREAACAPRRSYALSLGAPGATRYRACVGHGGEPGSRASPFLNGKDVRTVEPGNVPREGAGIRTSRR